MNQESSQMPISRQIRYFRGSRENWKETALEKQKKIRVYEQKIRDLIASREKWKTRAREAEKNYSQMEKEVEKLKKKMD